MDFPGGTSGKEPACQCRRHKKFWFDPWVRKIPHGYPLQYSCLENPMDRGAWRVTVHRIAESQTDWSNLAHYSKKRVSTDTESPLDYKIQPVHPKGNQSWIFIGRTDAEAETPILWPPDAKELTHLKRPWCWERLKTGGEGDDRGWDGLMASPTQWAWVWASSGVGDGQGSMACCSPWGHKE